MELTNLTCVLDQAFCGKGVPKETCDPFYCRPPFFRVGLLNISNIPIVVGVTCLFAQSIHLVPIVLKRDIVSSGPSALSFYNQGFDLWSNPWFVTRISFYLPEWKIVLNDLINSGGKEMKLFVAGLRGIQWRPVNLTQLFFHHSPVRRSCISDQAGAS